jgi:beta-phosphoglucomutase-like phosphatase (HAD superfamily)
MTVRAVIFDCDGTLVDSETLANQVLVDYLDELGYVMSVETRRACRGEAGPTHA